MAKVLAGRRKVRDVFDVKRVKSEVESKGKKIGKTEKLEIERWKQKFSSFPYKTTKHVTKHLDGGTILMDGPI